MKVPKKITPCPVLEAVVEIRFESNLPSDAIFGVIYTSLSTQYKEYQKLPILQVPEAVRSHDPNLKFQPCYNLLDDNFSVQIGSNVILISHSSPYSGWSVFSERIDSVLTNLKESQIISNILRFGMRYISFFEIDIFDQIKIKLKYDQTDFQTEQLTIRSLLQRNDFQVNLQLANHTPVNINNKSPLKPTIGSVFDIDIFRENKTLSIETIQDSFLKSAHAEQKKLFFEMLNDDFLKSLNPEY